MSLPFSDTTNNDGILQRIEYKLFGDNGLGRITDNTTLLQRFTGDCNVALDKAFALIFQSDGRWQFDDRNHNDYPILTTDSVAGQRDYSFTTDGNLNLILHIHKVFYKKSSGDPYIELQPRDQYTDLEAEGFTDGKNAQGTPAEYDKTANAIFLDPVPDTSVTNGIKLFVSREGNYFTTADTTQMPGFAGLFHEYIVYHVCFNYAVDNDLNGQRGYQERLLDMEKAMVEYYSKRDRHERDLLIPEPICHI